MIPLYSSYGTTYKLAQAVEARIAEASATTVLPCRIPELRSTKEAGSGPAEYAEAKAEIDDVQRVSHDDLRWEDGMDWGALGLELWRRR